MEHTDLKTKMEEYCVYIENALEKCIPEQEALPPDVYEAMRYSLLAGGKRLRPMLVLAACEAMGGKREEALPFACAIEMIHTYSLIHDDLPAMDNDDYRRGRPTNHKVYGEAMAILAGDGLLHHAMETMAAACVKAPSAERAGAMRAIAHGAGIYGMLAGQAADVALEGKPLDVKTLDYIHLNKTAAMIRGALEAGALLGGAEAETVKGFGLAGQNIGLAFQIIDDILDVTSTTEELGKPVHSDEKNQKATYAVMEGIEAAEAKVQQLSIQAMERIHSLPQQNLFLSELLRYLIHREK